MRDAPFEVLQEGLKKIIKSGGALPLVLLLASILLFLPTPFTDEAQGQIADTETPNYTGSDSGCAGAQTGCTECDEACVDMDADPLHCGECGKRCEVDKVCAGGECRDFEVALGCTACPCAACAGDEDLCCSYPGTTMPICVEANACF